MFYFMSVHTNVILDPKELNKTPHTQLQKPDPPIHFLWDITKVILTCLLQDYEQSI